MKSKHTITDNSHTKKQKKKKSNPPLPQRGAHKVHLKDIKITNRMKHQT